MSEHEVDSDGNPVSSPAERLMKVIRHEMRDTWRQDDQLLDKFFPVEPASVSKFSPKFRKQLYNDNQRKKR